MNFDITEAEKDIRDQLKALGSELWDASTLVTGNTDDPRLNSTKLYRRLWSNYQGFLMLWDANLDLEAEIIARSATEVTICIAANYVTLEEFSLLIRDDLVATLKSHIKLARDDNDMDLVRQAEAELRKVVATASDNPKKFDWKTLAKQSGQLQLYNWHKFYSMTSSHVTGYSLMRGVMWQDEESVAMQNELRISSRKFQLMVMIGTMALGTKLHAGLISAIGLEERADRICVLLNEISLK